MKRNLLALSPVLLTALLAALLWHAVTAPDDAVDRAVAPYRYRLWQWELQHVPGKWLYAVGGFLTGRDPLTEDERQERVERFFAINREIRSLEGSRRSASGDEGAGVEERLAGLRAERARLENTVEAVLEDRLAGLIREEGLDAAAPLFDEWRVPLPPVDFEFSETPHVLAVSPRDRIELVRSDLLRGDLSGGEVAGLEREVRSTGMSALVVRVSGVATYPSVVPLDADYRRALETMAHEWVHQYLFFHPLGFRYFESSALQTVNETVATIAGEELADRLAERYPLRPDGAAGDAPSRPEEPSVDFRQVMHDLRLRVDALLAEGEVEAAEAEMEETRRFLADHGIYIREINQAYFAFYGTYATLPQSSDPAGPRLEALRAATPSLGEFLRLVSGIRDEEDLRRILEREGVTPP